jgi:hypothetical protein
MGTDVDAGTAAERWPLVKALSQFGTFRGVNPELQSCSPADRAGRYQEPCGPATFDLAHGPYHSKYVTFVERDLLDRTCQVGRTCQVHLNKLSPQELAVYNRYGRTGGATVDDILASVGIICEKTGCYAGGTPKLPLILVDGFVQTSSQYTVPGEFDITEIGAMVPVPFLSFETIRTALQQNRMPKAPSGLQYPTTLLRDVNVDANLLTALICHADGSKPGKVCARSTIKQILKHVK